MIKYCEICGREFIAKNIRARFCGSTCRSRNARGVAPFTGELEPPEIIAPSIGDDEAQRIIHRARSVADDASRASMRMPAPVCLVFGRLAKRFTDALKEEGL